MTTRNFTINPANGAQVVLIPGGQSGAQIFGLTWDIYPTAGTALIEWQSLSTGAWATVTGGTSVAITSAVSLTHTNNVAAYRVTISSIAGGYKGAASVADTGSGVGGPPGGAGVGLPRDNVGNVYGVTDPVTGKRAAIGPSYLPINVRNSVSSAYRNNSLVNTPWYQSPTWKINEAIAHGAVRSGTDGITQWLASTFGTTAGSGSGPTGSGIGRYTDNGAIIWNNIGPVRGKNAWPNAGTIGSFTSASNPWFVDTEANIQAAIPNYRTLTPRSSAYTPFLPSGGLIVPNVSTNSVPDALVAFNPLAGTTATGTQLSPSMGSLTFYTDSNLLGFISTDFVYGALNDNYAIRVEIDDVALCDSCIISSLGSPAKPAGVLLNLKKIDMSRGRKVRIWALGLEIISKTIYYEATASIWAYQNANRFSIACDGTSIEADQFGAQWSWPELLSTYMGADLVYNFAQGSTGYISDNGGGKTNMQGRLPYLLQTNADVYVFGGPHNDVNYSQAVQLAAYTTYLKGFLEGAPSAIGFVLGCIQLQNEYTGTGGMTLLLAAENYIKSVVASINDPRLIFVPVLTDPNGPWVTGTGSGDSPANNGNSDKFFTHNADHPNHVANTFFAQRAAQAISAYFKEN